MKNKYIFKFADNGVIVGQPEHDTLEVVEYGEGRHRNAPVAFYLGTELLADIEEAAKQKDEAVQEWEIEVTIKPKGSQHNVYLVLVFFHCLPGAFRYAPGVSVLIRNARKQK